jgi:site-specific recombinase XerD
MENKELTTKQRNQLVETMAMKIATESPELQDLTTEQLEQIAKIVITQNLTNELNLKSKVANINYKIERDIFLQTTSKTGSDDTYCSYLRSLNILERYTKKNDINILIITPGQIDDFIHSLKGSPNSVRLIVAGISSFFSYLERRYSVIKNPIRGTKARPGVRTVKEIEIPTDVEMFTLLNELPELEKMAVYIMAYRGLRVGALNKMKVWGTSYKSYSKGKNIFGDFPVEVLTNIKYSDFNNQTPFENISTPALKMRIIRACKKLYDEGKIRTVYSAHDFRHYFAVSEYQKDKDIYRLSKLLDHTNISITETYLITLKIVV